MKLFPGSALKTTGDGFHSHKGILTSTASSWETLLAVIREAALGRLDLLRGRTASDPIACPWERITACDDSCRCGGARWVYVSFLREHYTHLTEKVELLGRKSSSQDDLPKVSTEKAVKRASKTEIARDLGLKINRHLQRFSRDPQISLGKRYDEEAKAWMPGDYYGAHSRGDRHRVWIIYVAYQESSYLEIAVAQKYLEWLDAGNVGRHGSALQEVSK